MFLYCSFLFGCGTNNADATLAEGGLPTGGSTNTSANNGDASGNANDAKFNRRSLISDVMADSVFGDYGRLLFPVQRGYWSGETLEQLRLTYYNSSF